MNSVVSVVPLPEQISLDDGTPFPLVLSPKSGCLSTLSDTVSFIEEHRDEILSRLLKSGAILFRGFPLSDVNAFDAFARAFHWTPLPYIGGAAPRYQVTEIVFTTNESPPSKLVPFHHEMAQVPTYPKHLMFYCEFPAKRGGETPIAYSSMIYDRIREALPEFVRKLEEKQVRYVRVLPNGDDPESAIGRGWQSTYLTQDRKRAEELCVEQGTDFEWLDNGCLKTITKILPAVRFDERIGKKTWFNSIVAAYLGWQDERNDRKKAVTFGDGELIDEADILKCAQILEESCVAFPWTQGDVLLIDNRLALHSRNSFEPPRRILAALFQ